MSFNEVKTLRKDGKLEEALEKALSDLEYAEKGKKTEWTDGETTYTVTEEGIVWAKRSLAWVYYDYLKKYSQKDSFDVFVKNLNKIKELQLPEDENMVFDNCAWQIGSLVFEIQKTDPVDFEKINELFEIVREFHFSKPSEAYTFIYKAFHKGYKNWSRYLEFADWWDFSNFRSEDFLKEEFKGKKLMSIAEQAHIAYSKKLLEGEPVNPFSFDTAIDREKIQSFLPRLNALIDKHPEYQYPPYFKAKLLLALGQEKNVLSAFLPFAKQKRNDFWVWELMAEIFPDDKNLQFSCYCKALSLNTPEDYLVKLRQSFAGMLVERQMYKEAKTEIEQIIATRSKHEWKQPFQIMQWAEQDWFKSAKSKSDNSDLYSQYLKKAEEILFQDIAEEVVAVEFVNKDKSIINFVKDKHKFGFFKYSSILYKPEVGDILKVRFSGEGENGYFKILTAEKADPEVEHEAIKAFEGKLKIIEPHLFGFVEDVFIEPKLIKQLNFSDGQALSGKAILSFNKKKSEWGWKAFIFDRF